MSNSERDLHPCFSCSLPDCNEGSPKCGLKRAAARYYAVKKRRLPVSDVVRLQYNIAFRELYSAKRDETRRLKIEASGS